MTLTRSQVRDLLERHGLRPSRALGQNFVVEANTLRQIVRLARCKPGDHVVEIGAGLGSLTLALAEAGAHVTAIEVDANIVPLLRQVVADAGSDMDGRIDIVGADAMTLDWAALLDGLPSPVRLVANLPYNIATPLVLDLLDRVPHLDPMLVMVQKEVGDRLAAAPGTAAYGIPSVKVAYWARAEVVAKVPATVFHPQPKVDSVLVSITRRRDGPATSADADVLFRLVRAGFNQRRKMLRGSLSQLVTAEQLAAAEIDPRARAETLDVGAWGRLASEVSAAAPIIP